MLDSTFAEAKETLYYLSQDQKERELADAREKFLMDQRSNLHAAMQEGMQKGLQQGILQNAKKMKAKGFTNNDIADITGLSLEEIQNL